MPLVVELCIAVYSHVNIDDIRNCNTCTGDDVMPDVQGSCLAYDIQESPCIPSAPAPKEALTLLSVCGRNYPIGNAADQLA